MRLQEEEVSPLFTEEPSLIEGAKFFYKTPNFDEDGRWFEERGCRSDYYSMVLCGLEWSFYPTWKDMQIREENRALEELEIERRLFKVKY